MSQRLANRIVAALLAVSLALTGLDAWLLVLTSRSYVDRTSFIAEVLHLVVGVLYTGVGALVVWRRASNRLCWLLLGMGVAIIVAGAAKHAAIDALLTNPGSLPGGRFQAWLSQWPVQIFLPGGFALLLILFPAGRPPSSRWRLVTWLTVAVTAVAVVTAAVEPKVPLFGGGESASGLVDNPFGLPGIAGAIDIASKLTFSIGFAVVLAASVAIFVRMRRASGELRQQLKWLGYFAVIDIALVTCLFIGFIALPPTGSASNILFAVTAVVVAAGIPVSVAIAVLRYRLYDIDSIISRSLVYGALAAFITAVYVAIVVGVGNVLGNGSRPNLVLSILATAVVAVAFQPVRERLQWIANRLVYGQRATPYEVLSQFARQVGGEYATEDVLSRIARALVEGSGAAHAEVYLRFGSELRVAARWPGDGEDPVPAPPLSGDELPAIAGAGRVVPVRHQGELLGALAVTKTGAEPLTPVEEKLLTDLASQAGLVLRNVRLTAELRRRLKEISIQAEELRRSRQRIVAAQDAERRRLERNIHDGAQQHLVALTVKLRLAGMLASRDPQRAQSLVAELQGETATALETLRELAGGIYPRLLRETGLEAALRAQCAALPAVTEIVVRGDRRRHPLELEAAVYFCCLEAIQNIAKYAQARHVEVSLEESARELRFSVRDDGRGFDSEAVERGSGLKNMTDRMEALGGEVTVHSTPGRGTVVAGRLPLVPAVASESAEMVPNMAGTIGAAS